MTTGVDTGRSKTATETTAPGVEDRLLAAALPLFAKHGFAGVSVRDIAAAAGLTTPSVYYYFDSKRGLYLRLLHDLTEGRATAMRAALEGGGDPVLRLRRVLVAYAFLGEEETFRPEVHLFLLRESFGMGGDMFPDLVDQADASNRRCVRTVLQDGIDQGVFRSVRVDHTAIAVLGVMATFVRRGVRTGKLRPEDGIAQVLDVVVDGLRPRS